ncbi:TonB-dependent receptor family protein [Rubrivivax sp. RP6-9]|uniref:TonB-dependent receptor family protein n=1 Tax=Rubrivivax sp. RP6-9 TaxID=3415750 RepID=UPI003CC6379F
MPASVFRRLAYHPLAAASAASVCLLAPAAAPAQEPPAERILITGSIVERVVDEAPYAITVVGRDALRSAGAQVNLSEALARVPGLVVSNRSNYAQDLQISSRGFGARAGFGVRGIRLLADGIPASGPDGQGQVAQFDLAGAERVEVLRGPFSVLYGNSSGGVISLVSAPVRRFAVEGEMDLGAFGFQQLRGTVAAPLGGGFSLRASGSAMAIQGFRPHSAARRDLASARLGWQGTADTVTVQASAFRQPAKDPLGLSRAQFDADPYQTAPQATTFGTRKDSSQQQLGASWTHRFADGALRDVQLAAYSGRRNVTQWLAIPAATQSNVRHGGGVIDFDRDFSGADLRARLSWQHVDLQIGAAHDRQTDARRGYENFTGTGDSQVLGVTGTLRRDETNTARSTDVYAQGEFRLGAGLALSAGVRSGRVTLAAQDAFLANGDDSGSVAFRYDNPVLGLRWQVAPGWQLFTSVARGFESPTLGEMAYRADGSGGFNTALAPQVSRQAEVGGKWRSAQADAELTLFQADVDDEIGVATNAGGRSAFQNVGRTQRRGVELAGGWAPGGGWRTRGALTWLDAVYADGFLTCAGIPCTAPTAPVPAGNRVAGAQRGSVFAELAWRSAVVGEFGVEVRGVGRTPVNDANSDFAAGHALTALRWSWGRDTGGGTRLETLVRLDNVAGRRAAGSVIVNDANGRYFEAAAPRALTLAVRVSGSGL